MSGSIRPTSGQPLTDLADLALLALIDPALLAISNDSNFQTPQDYSYGATQDSPFDPEPANLFDPTTATPDSQKEVQPQDDSQQPTQSARDRVFPRNTHLYPAGDTELPPGLTDEEICTHYPNHLANGHVLLDMYSRGLTNSFIYDNMPANTKRECRKADLNRLHTIAYIANGKQPLGFRQGKKLMIDESSTPEQSLRWEQPLTTGESFATGHPLTTGEPLAMGEQSAMARQSAALGQPATQSQFVFWNGPQPEKRFPRNSHNYPDKRTPLPAGLSNQEICARYPNHLSGLVLQSMKDNGFEIKDVYTSIPDECKTDSCKDKNLLHSRIFELRRTRR